MPAQPFIWPRPESGARRVLYALVRNEIGKGATWMGAELRFAIVFPEDGPPTIAEWDPQDGQTS